MKIYNIITFALILLALSACRKKEVTKKEVTEPESINAEPEPRKDSVNGNFQTVRTYRIEKNSLKFTGARYRANFSKNLLPSGSFFSTEYSDAGNVILNKKTLKKYGGTQNVEYGEDGYYYLQPPFKWEIKGNSDFKSFTHQQENGYIVFEGALYLPDSMDMRWHHQVYITGTDAEIIEVYLSSKNENIYKTISAKDNSILISSQDLISLTDKGKDPFEIVLLFENVEYKTYGGKFYQFVSRGEYYKTISPK